MQDGGRDLGRDRDLRVWDMRYGRRARKGQVWYTDFIVAVLIFVIALVIYYEYITNLSPNEQSIVAELVAEGKSVSNSLVSEGNPSDWNATDVHRIGITDGNMRINQTKLDEFYNMSYYDAHRRFNIRFDYYIYFENSTGGRLNLTGGDAIGKTPTDIKDIIQLTRVLIYDSELVKMQVQVWR